MTEISTVEVLDSLGMFAATAALPEQVAHAAGAGRGLEGLPDHEYVEQVVVLGMGEAGSPATSWWRWPAPSSRCRSSS